VGRTAGSDLCGGFAMTKRTPKADWIERAARKLWFEVGGNWVYDRPRFLRFARRVEREALRRAAEEEKKQSAAFGHAITGEIIANKIRALAGRRKRR
jgi:hypothetical protein